MSSESTGEFDRAPVSTERLLPARHFAASYAGEHVAGTEFVIGAMFVVWGVSTIEVVGGLILGNLLAVFSWALICAPIATDTRLTLYAYLEKIAGPGTIRVYSVINGVFFCVLGGAMITVSASAVRILFGIPVQVEWYPTSVGFVAVALCVGAVVVSVAIKGFAIVAKFAEICAPWMIVMFLCGALAMWPILAGSADLSGTEGALEALLLVGDQFIWVSDPESEFTFWHVAAFAWICNLPMHVGLSDMSVLRFARSSRYGYFSILGMFIGHFGAWICAGVMGAGAAIFLKTGIERLDAGEVAYQALGTAGIIAVIIAGWTTSNPTIYRAGLAFQSLNHNWSRVQVTMITGVITTVVACFPFVFTRLMDFLGFMGLLLSPISAIIVAEHWLFPRFGYKQYWSGLKGQRTNRAAMVAWGLSLLLAWILSTIGVHLFFLLVPTWLAALLAYLYLAPVMGAKGGGVNSSSEALPDLNLKNEPTSASSPAEPRSPLAKTSGCIALFSLLACVFLSFSVLNGSSIDIVRNWMLLPTVVYFAFASYWVIAREKHEK